MKTSGNIIRKLEKILEKYTSTYKLFYLTIVDISFIFSAEFESLGNVLKSFFHLDFVVLFAI